MRKRRVLYFYTILALLGLINKPSNVRAMAMENINNQDYSIEKFTSLPDNWKINTACDTSHITTEVKDDELILSHSGTNGGVSNYYGLMMSIADDMIYENFTFTMNFKMLSAENASRWLGVAYHTQGENDNCKGYLMNYRQNGESAASAFIKGSFKDEAKVSTSIFLNDNQYHQIKIVMDKNIARHYIDSELITSWDVNIKNKDPFAITNYYQSGGFSLIVNRSKIAIKSVKIVAEAEQYNENELQIDHELVSTYRWNSQNINFPTVVKTITSQDDFDELLNKTCKPSNVIMNIDNQVNIVDKDNKVIDSFYNIYLQKIKKQYIPIIRLDNKTEAQALLTFLKKKIDILDMAIMSSDISLIQLVRQSNSKVRAIYEAIETSHDMYDLVKKSQECGANTISLPYSLANVYNVTYLQARFKTVWIQTDSASEMSIYQSINTGCQGLIVNDHEKVYQLYANYDSQAMTRAPFNVSHRGLCDCYNENSLSGMEAAIKKGATHLEIDCYLTTDNEVVIMHDKNIERTTNGTGDIETYSLEQLKQFKLDLVEPYEDIPTLTDVIELIKDLDVVVALEIKSAKTEIVTKIKEKFDLYDCYDQFVAISFNRDILGAMKSSLKEIPVAFLGAVSKDNFKEKLIEMGQYHYVFDTSYSNTSKEFNEYYLRDRGISGWYWTFENKATTELVAIANGYLGLTNDVADIFAKRIRTIEGIEYQLQKNDVMSTDLVLAVNAYYYDKSIEIKNAQVFAYEDKGDYYDVICCLQSISPVNGGSNKVIYTEIFKVYKYQEIPIEPPNDDPFDSPMTSEIEGVSSEDSTNATASCVNSSMNILSYLLLMALGLIMIKKK